MRFSHVILFSILCILFASTSGYANETPLGVWIQQFRAEARAQNISDDLLDQVFADFTPDDSIITLDRKQPEGTITFSKYLSNVVTPLRIKEGQRLYRLHRKLLEEIGKKYGVPPQVIVALWGIETSYGKVTGHFNIPHALATLAYDGRRAEFFRSELLKSLQIIQAGHVTFDEMTGSWAGAMGQSQFMPSSYLNFAVDYDADGHENIWSSQPDVFASIANYLHKNGWKPEQTWGMKVRLPSNFKPELADIKMFRPLKEWNSFGVRRLDGQPLPNLMTKAAVMFPGAPAEGAYLVYENFPVILHWNRSRYFGVAVGTLADRIYGQ
ncbi:MAG: lytic murein transglycosylase [Rickettsiales bacterium]|nr:lytic murein transglycosylase [Rickettsiales bacterium]